MEYNTKQKGNITEMQCALAFMKMGYKVSFPYGEDCKYDLIVDTGNKLYRIQCKTASALPNPRDGFKFRTRSVVITTHGAKASGYSQEEIDFLQRCMKENVISFPLTTVVIMKKHCDTDILTMDNEKIFP